MLKKFDEIFSLPNLIIFAVIFFFILFMGSVMAGACATQYDYEPAPQQQEQTQNKRKLT